MRDRAIDEFESVFERAAIPVLDIRPLALERISVVLSGDPLDQSARQIGETLAARFGATVRYHAPVPAQVSAVDESEQCERFHSTAELIGQLTLARCQLVLLPEPEEPQDRAADKDLLVQGAAPPVLIVPRPIENVESIFQHVLHSLTGNFQQSANFSYSFGLVADRGNLRLLHTIDQDEIRDVGQAMQLAGEIDSHESSELLERMRHHGERYLKGVVAASRERPYEVSYELAVGEVVPTVRNVLRSGSYGLLVVGRHHEGVSRVSADDYQLMHLVRDVPVLAL